MARIRSIKPEFCTSEQVAECSTTSRLLFVLMWMFCDDAGRHPASTRRLKMECFPADDLTTEDVERCVVELINAGLLVEFEFEGKRFWQVTGWKHQRIDKPNVRYGPKKDEKTALPIDRFIVDHSSTIPRMVAEHSETTHPRIGVEGSGEDRSGVEWSGLVDKSSKPSVQKQSSIQKNPPTVEDVRSYMRELGRDETQAEQLVDHYTANGWVQGKGKPIKNWQAAVRNWFRNKFDPVSVGAESDHRPRIVPVSERKDWRPT